MRIISGAFKGLNLSAPKDKNIRPTLGRVRESIFNFLDHAAWASRLQKTKGTWQILDLFCGTGGLGIEALSRGGSCAIFMDQDKNSLSLAKQNIAGLPLKKFKKEVAFYHSSFDSATFHLKNKQFDLIFLDPPYHKDYIIPALALCLPLIHFNSILICETEKEYDVDAIPDMYECLKVQKFKNSMIFFLCKKS